MAGFWKKFADVAKAVAPVALVFVPGVPPQLGPLLGHAIAEAEQIAGASGADKKAHVLGIVTDALQTAAAAGKPIGDPNVIVPAVSAATDAVVASVNAIKAAHPPEPLQPAA